jgi:metal-sulfur cluster biosynthetic enzyme
MSKNAAKYAAEAGPIGHIALVAAAVSILSKEILYRATAVVAQRTQSQVLLANAWHHRSDAFSSIVALVSIWGAQQGGIPALDSLGGLFIAGIVGLTGLRVGWSVLWQLTDTQDLELKKQIEKAVVHKAVVDYQLQDDVLSLHAVRARFWGSRAWVDLEVVTNPTRSTSAATQVVQVLRSAILSRIPSVQDVAVVLTTTASTTAAASATTTATAVATTTKTESTSATENIVNGTEKEVSSSSSSSSFASGGRVATVAVNGAATSTTTKTTDSNTFIDNNAEEEEGHDEHHYDHDHDHHDHEDDDDTLQSLASAEPIVAVSPLKVEEDVRRALQQSAAFEGNIVGSSSNTSTGSSNSSNDQQQQEQQPQRGFSAVEHVLVHFASSSQQPSSSSISSTTNSQAECHVDIIVSVQEEDDANNPLSLSQAKDLAQLARQDVIRLADGVVDAKVSLELVRSGGGGSGSGGSGIGEEEDVATTSNLASTSSNVVLKEKLSSSSAGGATLDRNTTSTSSATSARP